MAELFINWSTAPFPSTCNYLHCRAHMLHIRIEFRCFYWMLEVKITLKCPSCSSTSHWNLPSCNAPTKTNPLESYNIPSLGAYGNLLCKTHCATYCLIQPHVCVCICLLAAFKSWTIAADSNDTIIPPAVASKLLLYRLHSHLKTTVTRVCHNFCILCSRPIFHFNTRSAIKNESRVENFQEWRTHYNHFPTRHVLLSVGNSWNRSEWWVELQKRIVVPVTPTHFSARSIHFSLQLLISRKAYRFIRHLPVNLHALAWVEDSISSRGFPIQWSLLHLTR